MFVIVVLFFVHLLVFVCFVCVCVCVWGGAGGGGGGGGLFSFVHFMWPPKRSRSWNLHLGM